MIVDKLVNKNFSENAENYDVAGLFQKKAAADFFELLQEKNIFKQDKNSSKIDILEVGAGTGFLTKYLSMLNNVNNLMVSDLSDEMLTVCEKNILTQINDDSTLKLNFAKFDFNQQNNNLPQFNVVACAMALQWANDLTRSVEFITEHLQAEASVFCFTTLTENTFVKLQEAFVNCKLSYSGPKFLTVDNIKNSCEKYFDDVEISIKKYHVAYDDVMKFLKGIQLTGAGNATVKKLKIKDLRAVVKEYEKLNRENKNAVADYEVATVICRKLTKIKD